MQKFSKIVLTGGPCAGKTTAKAWIEEAFSKLGYSVLFVTETATDIVKSGITSEYADTMINFETVIIGLQKQKERFYELIARRTGKKTLIVCDRGVLDAKAYVSQAEFDTLMEDMHTTEILERDSYDAVFHLVTAANGAPEAYTLDNNSARWESIEEAIEKDNLVINAWTGHPHLRIIDNSTSFEDKMKRLIEEIASFLGEPEPFEIERKYLIERPDIDVLNALPNCDKVSIVQTYLTPTEPDSERRIRQRGSKGNYIYTMTEKLRVSSTTRVEKEKRLSQAEYVDLLLDTDPSAKQVRKDRYCLTANSQYFEIDIYPDIDNFAVLEIELRGEDEKICFPEEIKVIKEITDDLSYSNYGIAHFGFPKENAGSCAV